MLLVSSIFFSPYMRCLIRSTARRAALACFKLEFTHAFLLCTLHVLLLERAQRTTEAAPQTCLPALRRPLSSLPRISPAKHSFELKLNAAYEALSAPAAVNGSSGSSSSLLLDHTTPVKTRDYMLPSTQSFHARFPAAQMPFSLPSGSLSYLDAYADSASPLLATQPLGDATLPQFMRSLQAQTMAWRQHQLYSPSDWLLEGDQNGFGLAGSAADPEAPRASPPQVSVPSRQGSTVPHAHEVRSQDSRSHLLTYIHVPLICSLSIFCRSSTLHRPRPTTSS